MSFSLVCLRAFVYILLIALLMHGVLLEGKWSSEGFREVGFTEFAQSGLLLVGCLFAWLASRHRQIYPHVALLSLALLLASLIREQDNYLKDHFFHGAWELLLLVCVVPILYQVIRHHRAFATQMRHYARSYSFGLFAAGFVGVYVYAQLFGREIFWQAVMGDHYVRVVKRAAEETSELFGYTLLMLAMIEMYLLVRRLAKSSIPHP